MFRLDLCFHGDLRNVGSTLQGGEYMTWWSFCLVLSGCRLSGNYATQTTVILWRMTGICNNYHILFQSSIQSSDEDLLTFPDICALCLLTGLKNFHWGMNVWPWAAFHSSNTCLNFCALWQSFVQLLYTYFSSFIIDEAGTLESDLSSHTKSDHIQIINLNKSHKNHKFQFFSPVKEEISYLSRII